MFKVGDIVRYSAGCTALARLHSPHAGGWHANHCLGGMLFVSESYPNPIKLAFPEDVEEFNKQWAKTQAINRGHGWEDVEWPPQPKETNPWVQTDELLPPIGKKVVIVINNTHVVSNILHNNNGIWSWYNPYGGPSFSLIAGKMWMPIPDHQKVLPLSEKEQMHFDLDKKIAELEGVLIEETVDYEDKFAGFVKIGSINHWSPSQIYDQAMPLLEKYRFRLEPNQPDGDWEVWTPRKGGASHRLSKEATIPLAIIKAVIQFESEK